RISVETGRLLMISGFAAVEGSGKVWCELNQKSRAGEETVLDFRLIYLFVKQIDKRIGSSNCTDYRNSGYPTWEQCSILYLSMSHLARHRRHAQLLSLSLLMRQTMRQVDLINCLCNPCACSRSRLKRARASPFSASERCTCIQKKQKEENK